MSKLHFYQVSHLLRVAQALLSCFGQNLGPFQRSSEKYEKPFDNFHKEPIDRRLSGVHHL